MTDKQFTEALWKLFREDMRGEGSLKDLYGQARRRGLLRRKSVVARLLWRGFEWYAADAMKVEIAPGVGRAIKLGGHEEGDPEEKSGKWKQTDFATIDEAWESIIVVKVPNWKGVTGKLLGALRWVLRKFRDQGIQDRVEALADQLQFDFRTELELEDKGGSR